MRALLLALSLSIVTCMPCLAEGAQVKFKVTQLPKGWTTTVPFNRPVTYIELKGPDQKIALSNADKVTLEAHRKWLKTKTFSGGKTKAFGREGFYVNVHGNLMVFIKVKPKVWVQGSLLDNRKPIDKLLKIFKGVTARTKLVM